MSFMYLVAPLLRRLIGTAASICLVATLWATPLAARPRTELPAMGFIEASSQSPLQQLRFGMQHHRPWVAEPHTLYLYAEHNWKNVWLLEPRYYRIDAEVHELDLRGCYGLGHGFDVSLDLPLRYVSGGILDGLIEGFHKMFGIENANRDRFPRNQFAFHINPTGEPGDWRTAGSDQIGWHLGNSVIAVSYALPIDTVRNSRATITANLKLPTGTRVHFFGGQSVDVGLSMCVGQSFGPVHLYLSPGVVYYGERETIGVRLHQWHYSGLVAVEYHRRGSRHAYIVQTLTESGIAEKFSEFSDATYELMLGYKYRLTDRSVLEFGFLENLFFFNNSPDISFHAGFVRQIGL